MSSITTEATRQSSWLIEEIAISSKRPRMRKTLGLRCYWLLTTNGKSPLKTLSWPMTEWAAACTFHHSSSKGPTVRLWKMLSNLGSTLKKAILKWQGKSRLLSKQIFLWPLKLKARLMSTFGTPGLTSSEQLNGISKSLPICRTFSKAASTSTQELSSKDAQKASALKKRRILFVLTKEGIAQFTLQTFKI